MITGRRTLKLVILESCVNFAQYKLLLSDLKSPSFSQYVFKISIFQFFSSRKCRLSYFEASILAYKRQFFQFYVASLQDYDFPVLAMYHKIGLDAKKGILWAE